MNVTDAAEVAGPIEGVAPGRRAVRRNSAWRSIYAQVLAAILIGIAIGWADPLLGTQLKVLGDLFTRFVRMLLVPIVFATITVGIAKMVDLKQLGRVGLRTIVYFEIAFHPRTDHWDDRG